MGVYIKGITKEDIVAVLNYIDIPSPIDGKELVEVTEPHGRLIDADTNIEVGFFDYSNDEHSVKSMTVDEFLIQEGEFIDTVIEAEGE